MRRGTVLFYQYRALTSHRRGDYNPRIGRLYMNLVYEEFGLGLMARELQPIRNMALNSGWQCPRMNQKNKTMMAEGGKH